VNAARAKNINLSFFLESKLSELLDNDNNQCGGQDSNPRTPAGADLESATFVHSVTPASYSTTHSTESNDNRGCGCQLGEPLDRLTGNGPADLRTFGHALIIHEHCGIILELHAQP
jgi:hypothetical protein